MKNVNSTDPQSSNSAAQQDKGFSPWQRLKSKRISYLVLPLIIMATITEFVILATAWKYQQTVCLPNGMGVTFFGIGPIGATILAVELLKLPLAIWTASRVGWQKGFMLLIGLPLICVLTFQLVKDMAVYEMGVAMTPSSQMLEKASAEEIRINQLNGELTAIETKKVDRESKLAELTSKKAKAKSELEESLKRNGESREDAISLTEYQKKELSEVEIRQAAIIKQFDADTEKLTKEIADLRARRETEVGRATTWNVEEARIENAYKAKLAEYTNKKNAYEKDKAEYAAANIIKRALMKEPVDPGVPPVRESNKVLKPAEIAELDTQIKTKEAELLSVNSKRRERVAQVEDAAHRVRAEFDRRSTTKREEVDRKREELLAAHATLNAALASEEKQVDQELAAAVKNVDGMRNEIAECRKRAESYYEAREESIKNTQVHRIATTVEIVRGLIFGKRPISITATAKERGDLYTDQISMVRIWVYPVLAFIVAFLPTLMVELGFSTVFMPERQQPPHRLGFFGRRLHWLYTRAGRQKILRAERLAGEASAKIADRDKALAKAKDDADKALFDKDAELIAAREAVDAAAGKHQEELKNKEAEWIAKLAATTDSLNRSIIEKDALRDLQKSEVDRQIQMRQNAWSDRLTQMRQELDDQRTGFEAERTTLMQEQHRKLMEVTEDCKTQVAQARRQMADAELAAVEKSAKLEHDLKEALHARDTAESQLKHQADTLSRKMSQTEEDGARELEKAVRGEKHRLERQQSDFEKTLRQREEDFERRLKQSQHELSLAFDARLAEEKTKTEQEARRRETELVRDFEARTREVDARWNQDLQQREEAGQVRLKQRDQQLQAQADARLREIQTQAEQELKRREAELERQLEIQAREAEARLRQELQQKELAFHAKLKQREQELTAAAAAREAELQNQWASDLRARQDEWEHQAESRVRATETRFGQDSQQKDEVFQMKVRQLEQELQAQFEARQAELRAQWDQELRRREQEWERNVEASTRAAESRWLAELQQKEELFQSKSRQRDQQWQSKLETLRIELQAQHEQELHRHEAEMAEVKQREQDLIAQSIAQAEAHQRAEKEWETEFFTVRNTVEPLKAQLLRTELERDEARHTASESVRHAQDLKKKLMDASSLLTSWGNGKHLVGRG